MEAVRGYLSFPKDFSRLVMKKGHYKCGERRYVGNNLFYWKKAFEIYISAISLNNVHFNAIPDFISFYGS